MPRLRKFLSGGLTGAGDMLMQSVQEDEARKRQAANQSAQSDRETLSKLLEGVLRMGQEKDPASRETQRRTLGALDPRLRNLPGPSQDELTGPMAGEIANAKSVGDLGSDIDVIQRAKATPGLDTSLQDKRVFDKGQDGNLDATFTKPGQKPAIEDLLRQREMREGLLRREESRGRSLKSDEAEAVATGTGRGQNKTFVEGTPGVVARAKEQAETLSPITVKTARDTAQANEDVQNNPRNVRGAANRAGAISGAQTGARLAQEFDPKITMAMVDRAKKIATAEAAIRRDFEGAKEIETIAAGAAQATMTLAKMKNIYDEVKTDSMTKQKMRQVGRATGMLQNFDPRSDELDRLHQGFVVYYNRMLGGTAQNFSDKDAQRIEGLLVSSSTDPKVGDQMFQTMSKMLALAPLQAQHLRGKSFTERVDAVERWMSLLENAPGGVATIIDPVLGVKIPVFQK